MCGVRATVAVLTLAAISWARVSAAQETVNYASVSGRVTDAQGAVAPGATVTARQTETNVTAETATDQQGRFRFPYLRVGPYQITVHLEGFADATRSVTLTVGSAFELPVSLAVGDAGYERDRQRRGAGARSGAQPDRRHGLADRSQESADERAQFPRSRAARAGRVADQREQHAALRRDVGGDRPGPVGRKPAQFLQQLHRRRPVGQRRRGGAERHSLRRRRRRPVSGRDLRRPGGTGTRARRLRQRRDEERHERRRTAISTAICATIASTRRMRSRARRCR